MSYTVIKRFIPFAQLSLDRLRYNLDKELAEIATLLCDISTIQKSSWLLIMQPLQLALYHLGYHWNIIEHLQAVQDSHQLRMLYQQYLPVVHGFDSELWQNNALYQHINNIKANNYAELTLYQQKVIDNSLQKFQLNGLFLSSDKRLEFIELQKELSVLESRFEQNVLDATEQYTKVVSNSRLAGIPTDMLPLYQQENQQNNYVITLQAPSYLTVMQYAQDRSLRAEIHYAYSIRASELSSDTSTDNTSIIQRILLLRQQIAKILGYNNFAELSLVTKMADSPQQILAFLQSIVTIARPVAQQELIELANFAFNIDQLESLCAWDIAYYSELLQQQKFNFSTQEIKRYFPLDTVLSGLLSLITQLYAIKFVTNNSIEGWYKDVIIYEVYKDTDIIAYLYLDLHTRSGKRSGAWMNTAQDYCIVDNQVYLPMAYIVCNFSRTEQYTLLDLSDLETLFHEFGHALHHILTTIPESSIAGTNGVAWDAVELPSQFMEYFIWDQHILQSCSRHIVTGDHLPDEIFHKIILAKNYHTGLAALRQIELSTFDINLHLNESTATYLEQLATVRANISILSKPAYDRMPNTFAHIFTRDYAAGYYSYKWAEVLACDIFSKFIAADNKQLAILGAQFQKYILSQGGLSSMQDNFQQFMGRNPTIDAMLQQTGLIQ